MALVDVLTQRKKDEVKACDMERTHVNGDLARLEDLLRDEIKSKQVFSGTYEEIREKLNEAGIVITKADWDGLLKKQIK